MLRQPEFSKKPARRPNGIPCGMRQWGLPLLLCRNRLGLPIRETAPRILSRVRLRIFQPRFPGAMRPTTLPPIETAAAAIVHSPSAISESSRESRKMPSCPPGCPVIPFLPVFSFPMPVAGSIVNWRRKYFLYCFMNRTGKPRMGLPCKMNPVMHTGCSNFP